MTKIEREVRRRERKRLADINRNNIEVFKVMLQISLVALAIIAGITIWFWAAAQQAQEVQAAVLRHHRITSANYREISLVEPLPDLPPVEGEPPQAIEIKMATRAEAFPAVGAGCNQNQNIVIENSDLIRNCTIADFKRDLWKGAIIMHASNYPSDVNCNWMLKDCIVKSNYGVAGQIISRTGMAQTEFTTTAINNTFYSEESGANSFEYTQGDSNLSPMSHGNTVTALNYQNT